MRLPLPLELRERACEPSREGVRHVVVARHGDDGRPEGAEESGRPLVLVSPATVGQVARGHDHFGLDPLDQGRQGSLDRGILACTRVQIGYMEEATRHDRMRL